MQRARGLVLQLRKLVCGKPPRFEDLDRRRPHRVGIETVHQPSPVDHVDSAGTGVDDDRRLADRLDLHADFLERLAARRGLGLLASVEKPARHSPPPAVGVSDEQQRAV